MKNLLILFLLLVSNFAFCQKRRNVVFDADTTTRPEVGFYGIGVRDSQPFLVKPFGNALMFDVSPTKIPGWQFNSNGAAPKSAQVLFINRDSLTIDLPNASDTSNRFLSYTLVYLGFNSNWKISDTTYSVNFADTIFAYLPQNKTTYWTKQFSHIHTQNFFRIKPFQTMTLWVDNRKWWLITQQIQY